MSNYPWMNDERSFEARKRARKAISAVDKSKQVFCLECDSYTTKMDLMTGESSFRRIGKAYYCRKCYGELTRGVDS